MKKLFAVVLMGVMLLGACARADYLMGRTAEDSGNYELAMKYWTEAAEQGDAESAYALGCRYDSGLHTEQDYAKALSYFMKAAEQGMAKAQHAVGTFYLDGGRGVAQDLGTAM